MSKLETGRPKTGGRKKGTPNKTTALLKDAIIQAATQAGDDLDPQSKDGLIAYLTHQAKENPVSFNTLLGKVLPMQVSGVVGGSVSVIHKIERTIVSPQDQDI